VAEVHVYLVPPPMFILTIHSTGTAGPSAITFRGIPLDPFSLSDLTILIRPLSRGANRYLVIMVLLQLTPLLPVMGDWGPIPRWNVNHGERIQAYPGIKFGTSLVRPFCSISCTQCFEAGLSSRSLAGGLLPIATIAKEWRCCPELA